MAAARQSDLVEEYVLPDSPIREHFAMMGAIAFVPAEDVDQTWRHLKPLLPADMANFAFYYENTWIGSSTTAPNFAHDMWNQHDASIMRLPRSSNIAEGWHNGFAQMLSCTNPSIWKFLDCLRSEQSLTDAKLTKRLLRERPEPRAPKWIRYDQQLQRIVQSYDDYANKISDLKAIGNRTML